MLKKILLVLCLVLSFATTVFAADSNEQIKERMKQRLTKINDYKDKGTVGEDNKGYLVTRVNDADADKITKEENADRKTVYNEIAKSTKASVDQVGQQRAAKIVEISKKGHWLQDKTGKWYQKQ